MRWGGAGLIAAVLALAGCKSAGETKPTGREPSGTAAARGKAKEPKDAKTPTWIDAVTRGPAGDTKVPKAGSWDGDPSSPNFNAKAAAQDTVGGKVVDTFNRPVKRAFIRIENVNETSGAGAGAIGIETDDNGYFITRGLKPGLTYNLTAEVTQEGKQLLGTVQTRVPNPILLITLREDLGGLPPIGSPKPAGGPVGGGAGGTGGGTGGFPPLPAPNENDLIPPMGLAPIGGPPPKSPRDDNAFRPDAGSTRALPPSLGGSPTTRPAPPPATGALPEPEDVSLPPGTPLRPENVANEPKTNNPFRAPPVSVPGPPTLPTYPLPPASPPAGAPSGAPGPKLSSLPRAGGNFRLLDSLERYWDFASDRAGSAVLVEFVTTSCPHCKPAVAVLKDAQSKYGAAGFQVVAVLCDEVPRKQRAEAAGKYARDNDVNYAVFVESGATPGDVRDRFGVEGYPSAVLLDANGTVLWKGHPVAKKAEMDAAIKKALGK